MLHGFLQGCGQLIGSTQVCQYGSVQIKSWGLTILSPRIPPGMDRCTQARSLRATLGPPSLSSAGLDQSIITPVARPRVVLGAAIGARDGNHHDAVLAKYDKPAVAT